MIKDPKIRSLLRKYANKEVMDNMDVKSFKDSLRKESLQLERFISWCERKYDGIHYFPPAVLKFLKCLSSISPVVSYFPTAKDFLKLLCEVKAGSDIRLHPEKLSKLQSIAPLIYSLVMSLPEGSLPDVFLDLLEVLKGKIQWLLRVEQHQLDSVSDEHASDSLSYLPNWPLLNIRGVYKKDLSKSKKELKSCRKDYRAHPSLMPGIFTLYCPHGILMPVFSRYLFVSRL